MNVKGLVQMLGCNVCLLEYRGYGHSDGSPHEEGLYLDAQAALEYLIGRPDVDQRKIIVFGRSLGNNVIATTLQKRKKKTHRFCIPNIWIISSSISILFLKSDIALV